MKRAFSISIIVLASIAVVIATVCVVLQNPNVQTKIAGLITDKLSKQLSTEISIDSVEYEFPNYAHLDGIFIADQRNDTLLFVEHITARFRLLNLFRKSIIIRSVEVRNAFGNIYRDTNGEMNYAFLASDSKEEEQDTITLSVIQVKDVWLNNIRFAYNDYEIPDEQERKAGVFNPNHIYVDSLNTKLALNYLSEDSLNAEIKHFYVHEKSGLQIDNIEAGVIFTPDEAYMPKMRVILPRSEISASVVHAYFPEDENGTVGDIRTELKLDQASLVLRDLAPLLPVVGKVDAPIRLQAEIQGTVDSIRARNLKLSYDKYTILNGDMSMRGLPDIDSAYVVANLKDLMFGHTVLQDFLSDMHDHPFVVPGVVEHIGDVHYHGRLQGPLNSLQLTGALVSKLGTITTNGILRTETTELLHTQWEDGEELLSDTITLRDFAFRGNLQTDRLELGQMLGVNDLGSVCFDIGFDGNTKNGLTDLQGDVDAKVKYIEYKDYRYNDITVNASYGEEGFKGKVNIDDEHLGVQFNGLADIDADIPVFNCRLNLLRAHLDKLNLVPDFKNSDARLRTNINFSASEPDNANGKISVDDLYFTNNGKDVNIDNITISAATPDKSPTGKRKILVQSDILNAGLEGGFNFKTLPASFANIIAAHLPSVVTNHLQETDNQYSLYIYLKDINPIADALGVDLNVDQTVTMKSYLDDNSGTFNLSAGIQGVEYAGWKLSDIALNVNNNRERLNTALHLLKHTGNSPAAKRLGDLYCDLNATARDDSLRLKFGWENKDDHHNKGLLSTIGSVSRQPESAASKSATYILDILPSDILFNDSVWWMDNSRVTFSPEPTKLTVNGFNLGTGYQNVAVNGQASKLNTDSLLVELRHINLDYLLLLTEVNKVISFGGGIDGWAQLYSLFSQPMFEADVTMDQAHINGSLLGDVKATANLDRENNAIKIYGDVTENNRLVAHVDGDVIPADAYWGLDIDVDSANLAFINFWTQDIMNDIRGRGFGHIKVYGEGPITFVVGKALGQNAHIGIPIIGASLNFNDSVFLEREAIRFPHMTLYDEEGNSMTLNGTVSHYNFKDFKYDLHADINGIHAMHLPVSNKDMFFGDVYANGILDIQGDEQQCNITVEAETQPRTDFTLSIATASTATDDSFVHFISQQPDETEIKVTNKSSSAAPDPQPQTVNTAATRILLNLRAEVDEDAKFNLLISRDGNRLEKTQGRGIITVNYDSQPDDATVRGTYEISKGAIHFNLQNIIYRSFEIQNGSYITFNGDPENPEINATAIYKTNASLRDLFGTDFSNVATSRTTVPVNCLLSLSGNLNEPTIGFGIDLPNSDESIKQQVMSIVNSTEEIRMREVLYLLAFNRFYTPEYMQSNSTKGLNETYSVLTSTLTGQINNWLSKLTENFTVGFDIRTDGQGSNSQQEYETQFQLQPTNRLLINGNLGYRNNDIVSNQPVFGNLDVEYMLTPSGQLRAKAYTHTVDRYSLREATTIQGVGLKFQQDFNAGDAKRNKEARKKRREERKKEREENKKKPNTNPNMHKGR